MGEKGSAGDKGPTGDKGPKGDRGPQGIEGPEKYRSTGTKRFKRRRWTNGFTR